MSDVQRLSSPPPRAILKVALFAHSMLSDWNHGNAHFLRGVTAALARRGHEVTCFEHKNAWSLINLWQEHGAHVTDELPTIYPTLQVRRYDDAFQPSEHLEHVDLVIVHEWNPPHLVKALGQVRRHRSDMRLLFHDTHHRGVSAPHEMERLDLRDYDGVLAFGEALRQVYVHRAWHDNVWTWHEAADVNVFRPDEAPHRHSDLVWVGNWGDDERTAELREFLLGPAHRLKLAGSIYGVRYPPHALKELEAAGCRYFGWVPNHRVPVVFAQHRVTVHVPRKYYARILPGIPTIRMFEAMACGIPLVSAPWEDSEGLFRQGTDYLMARTTAQMQEVLATVLHEPDVSRALARHALGRIRAQHTCEHRVDELLAIYESLCPRVHAQRNGETSR